MVLPDGCLDDCIGHGEAALALAREIDNRSGESFALLMLGFCLGSAGRYAAASTATAEGCRIASDIGHQQWMACGHCVQGYLSLSLFRPEEAVSQLQRALALAQDIGSSHWRRVASGLLAAALLLHGEVEQATMVLDAAGDPGAPARTLGERLVCCSRIELAMARGQRGLAEELLDQLEAATPNLDLAASRAPRLALLRGEIRAAAGKYLEAVTALEAVRQIAAEQGALPLLWRCEARRADLLRRLGKAGEARGAFRSMQQVLASLAEQLPDPSASEAFVQRALATLPRAGAARSRRQSSVTADGLTAREREVVALIRQGLSNRDIAGALYVGEQTVETHVTNVLVKLSFSTRAQVAAWAVQHDLG
jgi:DNA-binding NarL/FixJ family response regulator